MPHAALEFCHHPGCPELAQSGRFCDAHRHDDKQQSRRDLNAQRLYDRHWQIRRKMQLAAHPWCEDCLSDSIYERATEVHHEERHQGDRMKFIRSPLISLCKACHSRRTAKENQYG
jgi:5-methylcytosine-specific restriction protein A